MENIRKSIGIDVSKDSIVCCIGVKDLNGKNSFSKSRSFSNDLSGFEQLVEWSAPLTHPQTFFIMEATGVYYENLAYWLDGEGLRVHVLLANKVKYFAQSLNVKTKTDQIDSMIISQIGLEREFQQWKMPSGVMREIKFLCREFREAKYKIIAAKNQLHAKNHSYGCPKSVISRLKTQIAMLKIQLLEIEAELRTTVLSDHVLSTKVAKIETIPGVSFMTIICILAETNAFALVSNAKQLVSYAGMDIQHNQSGLKQGKTRISKKGNSFIRTTLYMPALASTRFNPDMKVFYDRLKERKPAKKIAVTAVARKLLILIYTLWEKDEVFQPFTNKPEEEKESRQILSAYTG